MQTLYGIGSCILTCLLIYSYRKIKSYMHFLRYQGLHMKKRSIKLQIWCLAIASTLDVSQFVTSMIFNKDCADEVMAKSAAGITGKVFALVAIVLWRVVTLIMCLFFMRQMQKITDDDMSKLMKDFQRKFAEDDDFDFEDIDIEEESSDSSASYFLHQRRIKKRKRQLIKQLLSLSKTYLREKSAATTDTICSVDINILDGSIK